MMNQQFRVHAMGNIHDAPGIGLPPEETGNTLLAVTFAGMRVTVLVDASQAHMIAIGITELPESFDLDREVFRLARMDWPGEWTNPADPAAWVVPAWSPEEEA